MNYEDQIILEQYFPYGNLTLEERNFYMNLILNLKELTDSITDSKNPVFSLVYLILERKNESIEFDGAISNGKENKTILGEIVSDGNSHLVITNIHRFSPLTYCDKDFNTIDGFIVDTDEVTRKTIYDTDLSYETKLDNDSFNKVDSFLQNKVNSLRLN